MSSLLCEQAEKQLYQNTTKKRHKSRAPPLHSSLVAVNIFFLCFVAATHKCIIIFFFGGKIS